MSERKKAWNFQAWYEKNKATLNKQRRKRYASDPEYRARIQQRNQDTRNKQRNKQKNERITEAEKTKRAIKLRRSSTWKTVEMEVNGVMVSMFTIGALAQATGKGISTIRVWERNGLLPETPHRTKKGDRLYTVGMVEQVRRALRDAGKLNPMLVQEKKRLAHVVRTVKFATDSIEMRLYKVGVLARAVNRTVIALTQMEKRGVFPRTPLSASSLKYRLYTLDMIEVAQRAFHRRGGVVRGQSEWQDLYDEIVEEWSRLGVMDAEVVE